MSVYQVTTKIQQPEWQVANLAKDGQFVCDTEKSAPGPVDYFAGAVNSCIAISARMVAKSKQVELKECQLETEAMTSNLGHGLSKITGLTIHWHLKTDLADAEQAKFIDHVLHVSTVYQTVKAMLPIEIELD
jgi:uncharacterized OsmC-like protein